MSAKNCSMSCNPAEFLQVEGIDSESFLEITVSYIIINLDL